MKRDRQLNVSNSKLRFYHVSPKRFRHGDVLVGGHPGGFGYAGRDVSMTTEPYPHITVKDKAISGNWFVYEVEPDDEKVTYMEDTGEYRTKSAMVVRNLGRVQGLVQRKPDYYSYSLPKEKELDRQRKRQSRRQRRNDVLECLRMYIAEALDSTVGAPYIRNVTSPAMSDREEIGPISKRDIDATDDDDEIASHLVDIEVTPEECYGPVPPDAEEPYVQMDPFTRGWSVLPTSSIKR
jgi:hypothetical protein